MEHDQIRHFTKQIQNPAKVRFETSSLCVYKLYMKNFSPFSIFIIQSKYGSNQIVNSAIADSPDEF